MPINNKIARYHIGQIVKHRHHPFRGVVFDVDPHFNNSEQWLESIPAETRPDRDQPFYHLLAENAQSSYIAYVSEQNLIPDDNQSPVEHPQVDEIFKVEKDGAYHLRDLKLH